MAVGVYSSNLIPVFFESSQSRGRRIFCIAWDKHFAQKRLFIVVIKLATSFIHTIPQLITIVNFWLFLALISAQNQGWANKLSPACPSILGCRGSWAARAVRGRRAREGETATSSGAGAWSGTPRRARLGSKAATWPAEVKNDEYMQRFDEVYYQLSAVCMLAADD